MYLDRRRFIVVCGGGALALASKYDLAAQHSNANGGAFEDDFLNPPSTPASVQASFCGRSTSR